MQVRYFYRYEGKQKLILCGHFTKKEVQQLTQDGWRESLSRKSRKPQNKHGIPVASSRERKREMQR